MPSPFPGMNPYLEQEGTWHKFHGQFCTHCMELLVPQVRPNYIVELDENVYVHELPAEERHLLGRSDLSIVAKTADRGMGTAATLEAPSHVRLLTAVDIERLSSVVIRDREGGNVVTVVELLSPANKESDRQQYLRKREEYLSLGASLVEIDLLRGGRRPPLEDLQPCDYYVMVARPEESPRAGVWPIHLRESLPKIPVPLRAPHADARLDLQAILHRLYDAGGYEDYIYLREPRPPLPPDDAQWAKKIIANAPSHSTDRPTR